MMVHEPTASCRCLALPELVREILYQIAPGAREVEFLSADEYFTLAVLARTAKLFHEQALDLLWQSLYCTKPVLACLPDNAWEEGNEASLDFDRFFKYARRIKRLHASCPNEYISRDPEDKKMFIEADAARIAAKLPLSQGFLLPEVIEVKLPIRFFAGTCHRARLLFGRKVQTLKIYSRPAFDIMAPDELWKNIIDLMCPIVGGLLNFELSIPATFQPVDELLAIYRQAPQLQTLKSMSVTIDKKTYGVLAYLPNLKYLAIPFGNGKLEDILDCQFDLPMFPALQLFQFKIDHLTALVDHMKRWTTRDLEEIHIDRSKWNDTWDLDILFETISRTQKHESLSCISIREMLEEMIDPALDTVKFTASGFRCLFVFRNLTTFCLTSHIPGVMNDELLEAAAAAWPQLLSFEFNDNTPQWTSSVSVQGMIKFISACKKLHTFSLSVNFSSIDNADFSLKGLPSFHQIESLNVRMSVPPSAAVSMVTFLHHVFPKVNSENFKWCIKDTVFYRDNTLVNDEEFARAGHTWREVVMALKVEYYEATLGSMGYEEFQMYQNYLRVFAAMVREVYERGSDNGEDGENGDDGWESGDDDDGENEEMDISAEGDDGEIKEEKEEGH